MIDELSAMNDASRSGPETIEDDRGAVAKPAPGHPSSMTQRLGWLHRLLSRRAFAFTHVERKFVDRVRKLGQGGTVVYVMRNRSVADYLLVRSVLVREGLPLPEFANELAIGWFRPLGWIAARIRQRLLSFHLFGQTRRSRSADRERAARLVAQGRPVLLFLRARAAGLRGILQPGRALESQRIGDAYLEDVLATA
ncbi:MAG: hypothetical protein ACREQQ_00865, partial [Candidatus Binatia bacterium]